MNSCCIEVSLHKYSSSCPFYLQKQSGEAVFLQEQHLQPVLCSVIAEHLNQGNGSSIHEGESEVQRLPPALERLVMQ